MKFWLQESIAKHYRTRKKKLVKLFLKYVDIERKIENGRNGVEETYDTKQYLKNSF